MTKMKLQALFTLMSVSCILHNTISVHKEKKYFNQSNKIRGFAGMLLEINKFLPKIVDI